VLAKAQPQYKYIHILGGTYDVGASTLNIGTACYIDGAGTTVKGPAGMPVLHFGYALGGGVLSGVTVQGSNSPSTTIGVTADIGTTLEIFDSTIVHGLSINDARVTVDHSTFSVPTVAIPSIGCTSGDLTISDSEFDAGRIESDTCTFTLRRNRFQIPNDQCFSVTGGLATIENNVFVGTSELQDCGGISSVLSGSTVRFNTFVNMSDLVADGSPLHCDSSASITSNIFAWGSTAPNAGGCMPVYSLFDNATTEPLGMGSLKADLATFFVNRAAKDFHLSASSPAIGKAQSGLGVTSDIEGSARPSDSADIGAYEH
jgi:hypothetical protein